MPEVNIDALQEQVVVVVNKIEQEAEDLEYVINRIQTGVDFLPLEVQDDIQQWKDGRAFKEDTFEDLKRKCRYKAYSIDDGWELFHMYNEWIVKQHRKLLIFVKMLGVVPQEDESFLDTVKRSEIAEWDKAEESDMDVIFMLKDIRDGYHLTRNMEKRLRALEAVCRKRSDMIIAPSWEPRGSL